MPRFGLCHCLLKRPNPFHPWLQWMSTFPLKYTDAYLKDLETMLFRVESIISDFPIQFLHSSPLRQTYSKV